jgi:hypothetical protein
MAELVGTSHAEGSRGVVKRSILIILASATCAWQAPGQTTFVSTLYPILEKAGCRNCHNLDGVASATRLHFPDEDAPLSRVEVFGRSLVDLVSPQDPEQSLLFLKPTARIAHTGGQRIKPGSPEEAVLKQWIDYLANMSGPELEAARRYKQEEAAGGGKAPVVVLRRLTNSQYNNTIRDLLKDTSNPASDFPPEDFVNGFKDQYEALSVTPLLAEAYGNAAEKLAADAFLRGDFHGLIPCKPASDNDAACRTKFIKTFGRRAFRRPLEPEEVARYTNVFRSEKPFLKGAQTVIEAMLQSPDFIFWLDETPNPKWKPYATASFLSYSLWNTMPDDAVLDAVARGELNTTAGIEQITREMLADPRAKDGLDSFVSEWLRFDRVFTAARERRVYPLFNADLAAAMTEEARHFVGDLVWNDRNFMQVYTANWGFPNSSLAAIYRVPPPAHDWDRVIFPADSERAGLLGQALFLTLTSKPDETAPTGRGLFVREQFLCQEVPPPPPNVDTNLPPFDESKPLNNRQRMSSHATNPVCASCHNLMDPIGFGLEKYDAIGERREQQKLLFFPAGHGVAARRAKPKEVLLDVDTNARVAGIADSDFTSARQLGELLARTPQCQECIVKQVFRYMAGRSVTPADRPALNRALDAFRKSDFNFKSLLVSLIKERDNTSEGGSLNVASNH